MIIALVSAMIHWNYIKDKPEKWFLYFMVLTVSLEIIANVMKYGFGFISASMSNVLLLSGNILIYLWFYEYLKDKKLLIISSITTLIVFTMECFYRDFITELLTFLSYTNAILIIIHVFAYLRNLLSKNEVINFKQQPAFWLSISLLIYQLFIVFAFVFLDYTDQIPKMIFYLIITIASVIFYLTIASVLKMKSENG